MTEVIRSVGIRLPGERATVFNVILHSLQVVMYLKITKNLKSYEHAWSLIGGVVSGDDSVVMYKKELDGIQH